MESIDGIERQIDAALSGPEPDFEGGPTPPPDADIANRWLYRLGRMKADLGRLTDRRADEIAKIDAVYDGPIDTLSREITMLTDALKAWHRAERKRDESLATFKFPNGVLRSQQPRTPKLKVDDEAAFVAWAKTSAPGLLREVLKPDHDAIKKTLVVANDKVILDGEIVPGVHPDSDATFSVETK